MITVNAVGKACPEPVIMTRAAVEKGAAELEILRNRQFQKINK